MNELGKQLAAELLEKVENCKLESYQDEGGIWTIAIGCTHYINGEPVGPNQTCTLEQAHILLKYHLEKYVYPLLAHYLDIPPRIYAALCSFIYNEGHLGPSLKNAIMLKQWTRLPDCFREYIIVKGRISQGLKNRREEEINFFKSEIHV